MAADTKLQALKQAFLQENLKISSNCKIVLHRSGEVICLDNIQSYVIDMSFLGTHMDMSWKWNGKGKRVMLF